MKFLKKFNKDWQFLAIAAAVSFGFVGFLRLLNPPSEDRTSASVDTYIPSGFVLIPIEVQNYESLDSLLGKFGVVDLFRGEGKNGRPVARNIRILRAPNNPSHFAVLAPENQAAPILSNEGNFYVALKPPSQTGTQIVSEGPKQHSRVQFDGE